MSKVVEDSQKQNPPKSIHFLWNPTCSILGAGLFGQPGPDGCYKERRLRIGCSLQGGDCAWLGLGPVMTKALWGNIWLSHF